MKKQCPDLVNLNDEQLIEFWEAHRPEELRNLGDRLLAESLPLFSARPSSFYLSDLAARREAAGRTLEQMAQSLSINPSVLQAWETGEVRAPASLSRIYLKL